MLNFDYVINNLQTRAGDKFKNKNKNYIKIF